MDLPRPPSRLHLSPSKFSGQLLLPYILGVRQTQSDLYGRGETYRIGIKSRGVVPRSRAPRQLGVIPHLEMIFVPLFAHVPK